MASQHYRNTGTLWSQNCPHQKNNFLSKRSEWMAGWTYKVSNFDTRDHNPQILSCLSPTLNSDIFKPWPQSLTVRKTLTLNHCSNKDTNDVTSGIDHLHSPLSGMFSVSRHQSESTPSSPSPPLSPCGSPMTRHNSATNAQQAQQQAGRHHSDAIS